MPVSTSKPLRVAVLADSDTRWKWGALTAARIVPDPHLDGYLLRGRATPTPRQLQEVGVRAASLREVTALEFLRAMRGAGRRRDRGAASGTPGADASAVSAKSAVSAGSAVSAAPAGSAVPDALSGAPGVPGVFGVSDASGVAGARGARAGTGGGGEAPEADGAAGDDAVDGEAGPDVIVLALVGGGVQAVLHGLAHAWRGRKRRPVVVTGYVGVVYEKLADGLLLRHGADVVLANSRQDAERFREVYAGVGADASCVVEAALPFLGGAPYERGHDPYTVVFAAQPSVPDGRVERGYLLGRLVEHAKTHPERQVLLKLRSKPGEHTTHIEELPYQRLAQRFGPLPENFYTVYGHMGEVLDRTDLLVTVSSTAALESLHRRIPTAVLTDLGVREKLGNHHFLGSGCLTSWDRLDAGDVPEPDPRWLARQGVGTGAVESPGTGAAGAEGYERFFDAARARVTDLLARAELPQLAPYYTPTTAPGYLPGILARHHLAPDGSALPGAPDTDRPPGPVRQAVRRAARGAYRHGVQRVAPVIRRMGEL